MVSVSLVRLVGRPKARQRKCSVDCAQLEASQRPLTRNFAVPTHPARSLVVKWRYLGRPPLMPPVGTVCLGKEWRPVLYVECLSLVYFCVWTCHINFYLFLMNVRHFCSVDRTRKHAHTHTGNMSFTTVEKQTQKKNMRQAKMFLSFVLSVHLSNYALFSSCFFNLQVSRRCHRASYNPNSLQER